MYFLEIFAEIKTEFLFVFTFHKFLANELKAIAITIERTNLLKVYSKLINLSVPIGESCLQELSRQRTLKQYYVTSVSNETYSVDI